MLPPRFKIHEITVEVRRNGGMHGDTFDPPATFTGQMQDGNQLVRSASGEEVVATGTVWLEPDVEVTPGSRITARGRSFHAIAVFNRDSPSRRLDHVEVTVR